MKQWMIGAAAAVFLVLCMAFAGCTGEPADQTGTGNQTSLAAGAVESVVDANNQFAFDLYKELAAAGGSDNIFFSPFSISSAFAITYEGARGNTADEIASVFSFPDSINTLRAGFLDLNDAINAGDDMYSLSVANALWAEETYPFLESYIETAETYYSANTTNLNFTGQPEESRDIINVWAEDKTNGKITDLLPEGSITSITKLVITNAIYFKGTWVKQFDQNETQTADFTTASGETVSVGMMQRTDDEAIFGYNETDDLQILSMPYEHESGRELSMVVILPKENDLGAVEEWLDAGRLDSLEESLEQKQIRVFFPKFELETEYDLSGTLEQMGMPEAFSTDADFSGMDGTKNLFISDVVHKAYVDINEEGTEAAAATGVVVSLRAVADEEPVPVFRADHPFIFLIQDDETGNILFMGRYSSPPEI